MNELEINKEIKLGVLNNLKIDRITEPGMYLEALDEEVVLLPNCYVTDDMQIDDVIEVFIYTDSEDRLVATTQEPYAMKDQFMFTKVVDVLPFGAFVEWGLQKDLFVPKNKQKTPFQVGEARIIRVLNDDESDRLIGVEKITSFLSNNSSIFERNDIVDLLIFAKTPMGYKAIINDAFEGMLYNNELFTKINVGMRLDGYIKAVREDGKIDLSLQLIGSENSTKDNETKIMKLLKQNDGELSYNYKTDAAVIKNTFGISKKAYKKTLTSLINANQIKVDDTSIIIIEPTK